jgi:hypothetical protein
MQSSLIFIDSSKLKKFRTELTSTPRIWVKLYLELELVTVLHLAVELQLSP